MLVLSRKKLESIIIGGEIEIKIVAIEGDMVRIGIEAPKHIEVLRKEIYESVRESNKQATVSQIDLKQLSNLFTSQTIAEKKSKKD